MRGYLIEIATDVKNAGNLNADDFACTRDGHTFAEWYEDADRNAALEQFEEWILRHGGIYYEHGGDASYMILDAFAKKNIFAGRYKQFIQRAGCMTLDAFASGGVDEIKRLIEDTYGDAVYLAEEEYAVTMDKFIRMAEPGEKYYIGNIVLMH